MSLTLRICLIIASIFTLGLMIHKIRSSKVQIEDAIYWVVFSAALIVLSVFPQIIYLLSDLLGVESPANLIFLLVIFFLIVKLFTLSVRISGLETRIKELAQQLALSQTEAEDESSGTDDDKDAGRDS